MCPDVLATTVNIVRHDIIGVRKEKVILIALGIS